MKKLYIFIISIFILGLVTIVFLQYADNRRLKDNLGMIYASNISNFAQHLSHIETYLQTEKKFTDKDLTNYYYEANYLMTVKLPSDTFISPYIGYIQNGFSTMNSLVSKGANNGEFEIARNRTLQLVFTLKEVLNKMDNAGRVKVSDGFQVKYKEYYELSLPENKAMKLISNNLETQLKEYMKALK